MTKSIKELAKKYNAIVDLEDLDSPGNGTLVKNFDFDNYMDGHEEKPAGRVSIESVIEFKSGEPTSAMYYVVVNGNYGAGNDDDIDGVLDLWTK